MRCQPLRPYFSAPCWGLHGFNLRGKKAGSMWGESEGARDWGGAVCGCSVVVLRVKCWSSTAAWLSAVTHRHGRSTTGQFHPLLSRRAKGSWLSTEGPHQAPAYRLGIDMVPWRASGGGGGDEATWWAGSDEVEQRRGWWERLTH